MTKREIIQKNRKIHRYLGLLLGIQFLLWTIGGLYFSWTNIEEIRGDNLKKELPFIAANENYISPEMVFKKHFNVQDSIISLKVKPILHSTFYVIEYLENQQKKVKLINAVNGRQRPLLTKEEAILIAKNSLNIEANILKTEFLLDTGKHHEYRGRPIPAYAITFDKPANTTIYISQEYANVQTFRSNKWRVFDFLWMLHTMDYQERDNFNNFLLRAFSFFGIFTILSGFSLYYLTSRKRK